MVVLSRKVVPPVIFEIVAAIYVMDSLGDDFSERRKELSLVLFITLKLQVHIKVLLVRYNNIKYYFGIFLPELDAKLTLLANFLH